VSKRYLSQNLAYLSLTYPNLAHCSRQTNAGQGFNSFLIGFWGRLDTPAPILGDSYIVTYKTAHFQEKI
jgi:lipopolysaccharide biosynthesis regulator YciM